MTTYTKKSLLKHVCLLLLFGLFFYLAYSVEQPGYCSAQNRFLSDEELIEAGVHTEAKIGKMKADETETSIRTFHTSHPGCCSIDRTPSSMLERSFGMNIIGVNMFYDVNDKISYRVHMDVQACGQVKTRKVMELEKHTVSVKLE